MRGFPKEASVNLIKINATIWVGFERTQEVEPIVHTVGGQKVPN